MSAISPSSRFLAAAMATGLGPQTGKVVEFGPGTGQLTRAILAAGVAPQDLTLFEMSADFARLLTQRFAKLTIHRAGAQDAASHAAPHSVGVVISGLPLLSMPRPVVEAIVAAAFTILRKDGEMRQFTYGPNPPIAPEVLNRLGLVAIKGRKVWANLPPARVYIIKRAAEV
ncbi:MAG: methyltransferase domain-containing protein [Cypionkella sp.]|nr:methyltransferase domain-containing protein [Cypionkella sp.]